MLPFPTERWREMEIWKVRALYCTVYPIGVLLSSPFKSAYFAGKNVWLWWEGCWALYNSSVNIAVYIGLVVLTFSFTSTLRAIWYI